MTRPRAGLFFVSDGMRPDLVERYAAEGVVPAMAAMLRDGVHGRDGCLPPMPTNTGAGWATLATGAWSGRTGAINNTLHMPGDPINVGRPGFGAELIEADTLVEAAERRGLRTLTFEWASSVPAKGAGPVVSYRSFFSARGVVATYAVAGTPGEPWPWRDLFATVVALHPAAEWRNVPEVALPPMACSFVLPTRDARVNPDRTLHALLTASTASGYDTVTLAESMDAAQALLTLTAGSWGPAHMTLANGKAASLWVKCVELSSDLSRFRLYFTTLSRPLASPPELEDRVAAWDLPPPVTADYSPFQAGLVDEETYVEQAVLWWRYAYPALARLVEEYQPDLLLAGAPLTDEFSHQFMALTTPSYPRYDPATAPHYEDLIRQSYRMTDEFLAYARSLMPPDTVTVISSDHGFGAAWMSVNANLVLRDAGLLELDAARRPDPASRAVAYGVGGTANVYLNVKGRDPGGVIEPAEVTAYQTRIIDAFTALRDPAAPSAPVLARAVRREEADAVETGEGPANMLHPTRTGDVLVFVAPPYQFDGASPTAVIAEAPLLGQHGYLPDVVDLERDLNMRSAFLMDGPGVRAGIEIAGARAIDLAPTLAYALGIPGPNDADGRVLVEAFEGEGGPLPLAPSPAGAGEGEELSGGSG